MSTRPQISVVSTVDMYNSDVQHSVAGLIRASSQTK